MAKVRDKRRRGWFWMDNAVVDDHGAKLGAYAIAVYAVLCRHASNDDGTCQVGINTIGRKIGCSRNSVKRALRELEDSRLIEVVPQFDGDWQHASEYVILDASASIPGSPDDRGHDVTGVTSGPGVGHEVTRGGSPQGHLDKDSLVKDLKAKDSVSDFQHQMRLMTLVRMSPSAPSQLVAVGRISAAEYEALRSNSLHRRELERLEEERSPRWIPQ